MKRDIDTESYGTVPAEESLIPTIPILQHVEILGEREGGLVECYIPTQYIDHEEVPVKEEWAQSLADQMKKIAAEEGGTGQQTPIQLGWIEGEEKLRIIDGFHRDKALVINGVEMIYATVKKTDWNKLYDMRIFTAKDHAHVRFSRVVQWIQEVWQYSGISDDLSVEQAILLYRFDTSGAKLGIDPKVAEAAKQWVAVKEEQWGMKAMTIHSNLSVASSVDPKLVHSTREKTDSHKLTAPTQSILKIFSKEIPIAEDRPHAFELQNLVIQEAMRRNLKGPQVTSLCKLVQDKKPTEAAQAIQEINWETWEPTYGETTGRQLRRASDPRHKGALALAGSRKEVSRVLERTELALERGEEVTDEMAAKLDEALTAATKLVEDLGALALAFIRLKSQDGAQDLDADTKKTLETFYSDMAELIAEDKPSEQAVRNTSLTSATDQVHQTSSEFDRSELKVRNRKVMMNLPDYGKFLKEDWWALEPHYRFALALNHPEIAKAEFTNLAECIRKVAEVAQLDTGRESLNSKESITNFAKPIIDKLRESRYNKHNVIARSGNKLVITPLGKTQLEKVVYMVLKEVDDSREAQPFEHEDIAA